MSGGKDGQTLFYKILPATAMGLTSKTTVNWHLKVKDIEYNVGLTKSYCITLSMQKISSTHSADFRVSWTKWPCSILTTFTQKLKLLLAFHAKNQFIPSTYSWDTVNFRVLWPGWPHPINSCEFVSTCKKSGYFIDLFWRYGWLKNPAIWSAENILAHISATKIFPSMGSLQGHSK